MVFHFVAVGFLFLLKKKKKSLPVTILSIPQNHFVPSAANPVMHIYTFSLLYILIFIFADSQPSPLFVIRKYLRLKINRGEEAGK